jgi:hypothetical protein
MKDPSAPADDARDELPDTSLAAPEPAPPPSIGDDRFVLAWTSTDPVEAQMLVSALEQEGIATTGLGRLTAAQLGVGNALFEVPIFVPAGRLDEAQELIASLLAAAPDASDDEPAESHAAPKRRARLAVVLWILAVLVALGALFLGRLAAGP